MGSVKDLRIMVPAQKSTMGRGIFHFTDDYSVFDYGKMPDVIPEKGAALCIMASYNFQQLEKRGIKTHFAGMPVKNKMEVSLTRVCYPQKGEISAGDANYLVPLEVIYRNTLPAGSSVFKRLKKGSITYHDLGLEKMPVPGEVLEKPIIDFSTKLEETDRYLTPPQAMELAQLSEEEFENLKKIALKVNSFLTEKAKGLGLEHADGKVEFCLNPKRELLLVDVCGTLDEDRFLFQGIHLSKQVLRDYYKTTPWAEQIAWAQEAEKQKPEWPEPPVLPSKLITIVSNLYKSVTEAWTGKTVWGAPSIEEAVTAYTRFLEQKSKSLKKESHKE